MTHYLPLGVRVDGLLCVVIGGGRVGTRKALTLLEHGAQVKVLSPEISDRMRDEIQAGNIEWDPRTYYPECLLGVDFVVAATSDPALNVRIAQDARNQRVWCCVAAPGRFSQVIFPASYRNESVTVAVHSDGRDCALSRRVRDRAARWLEEVKATQGDCHDNWFVWGVKRNEVSDAVFESLAQSVLELEQCSDVGGGLVVCTCARWEWYGAGASPHVLRHRMVEDVAVVSGVELDLLNVPKYEKSGVAAVFHLLRVLTGLDSPLPGETDIVGQVRHLLSQRPRFRSDPLWRWFQNAVSAQKQIRRQSGLAGQGSSWAQRVLDTLVHRLGALDGKRVDVVGCGALGKAIIRSALEHGAIVQPVSYRAHSQQMHWCHELGITPITPAKWSKSPSNADAVVVVSKKTGVDEKNGDGNESRHDTRQQPQLYLDLTGRSGMSMLQQVVLSGAEVGVLAKTHQRAFERAVAWWSKHHPMVCPYKSLRVGTRGSRLAQAQTTEVLELLRILDNHLDLQCTYCESPGDRDKTTPLPQVADDDFFTRDLDVALVEHTIDVAVHSAKDLPQQLRQELCVAAVLPSHAPWETLVTADGKTLAQLPVGARVGTSSTRRSAQIRQLREDLVPTDIRGDVPSRLAALDAGGYDALILAAAGLVRINQHTRISEVFDTEVCAPEPGQGSLALVTRADDKDLRAWLAVLHQPNKAHPSW